MNYIDTHSHQYSEEFLKDIDEVILKAKEAKVTKIILPNIDVDSIEPMISLCKKDNCFYPTLGLHPTSVDSNYRSQLKTIESYLEKLKIYAIGEIGIDLYWDKTYL
ncbi:MAG: TatD family hydrolase, partial [Bacteroidaceae bacterium]|nr:TatD family hydrolase [Bacteroidaceae bacterium]